MLALSMMHPIRALQIAGMSTGRPNCPVLAKATGPALLAVPNLRLRIASNNALDSMQFKGLWPSQDLHLDRILRVKGSRMMDLVYMKAPNEAWALQCQHDMLLQNLDRSMQARAMKAHTGGLSSASTLYNINTTSKLTAIPQRRLTWVQKQVLSRQGVGCTSSASSPHYHASLPS